MKREIDPEMLYLGTTVVPVSSLDEDGTTELAQRSAVVPNLVDAAMVDAVDRLALPTGRRDVPADEAERRYRHAADEFAAARLAARGVGMLATVG